MKRDIYLTENDTVVHRVTIRVFGTKVAVDSIFNLASSHELHRAYAMSATSDQKDMRREFLIGYMIGKLNIDRASAMQILRQTRRERLREHELVVNAGAKKFSYHFVRNEASCAAI